MLYGDTARQLLPLEPEFGSGQHLPVAAAGAVAGAAVRAITGAPVTETP
ncbi:hypothetical protein ACFWDQ_28045 [Streptomyces sp. NPDC060053]